MTRRPVLIVLLFLGLIEAFLLISGYRNRHRPEPAPRSAGGQQDGALPYAIGAPPTLYLEPAAGFTWLYDLVNGAKSTIEMTMYELVDTTFSADLVQACQRGVKVELILDGQLERTANTPAYNQIAAAGPNCAVAWSQPRFAATHQKTITIDGQRSVVMSANLTSRYYADTRDMALIDTDAGDIAGIHAVFQQDLKDAQESGFTLPLGHNLIWSPETSEDNLVSLINGAKKTLSVENEELSATSVVSALTAACKRGVQLQLAMTDTSADYHANYTALEAAGCGVHVGANNDSTLYIHAKAIIADLGTADALGYVGSINFSNASLTRNRELGLYVHDVGTLGQISAAMANDYNQFPAYTAAKALPNTDTDRPS